MSKASLRIILKKKCYRQVILKVSIVYYLHSCTCENERKGLIATYKTVFSN